MFDDNMSAIIALLGVIMFLIVMFIVSVMSQPNELDNGCIVYNDKIYCEEINMEE